MFLNFLVFEQPYLVILIIPIIHSYLTTSKKYMKTINILSLFIFALIEMILFTYYVEPYLIIAFLIYLLIDFTLIKKIIKSKVILTENQKVIYNNFSDFLTEEDFLLLFNSAKMVTSKTHKKLVSSGADLNKVYYFAVVPNYCNIHIKYDNIIISYIKSHTWIGLLEFIFYYRNSSLNKYLIDLCMEHSTNDVVYYEWDIDV
jgi:hypothetical protein